MWRVWQAWRREPQRQAGAWTDTFNELIGKFRAAHPNITVTAQKPQGNSANPATDTIPSVQSQLVGSDNPDPVLGARRVHAAPAHGQLPQGAAGIVQNGWTIFLDGTVDGGGANLRPALAALAILFFVNAWNEYFWPAMVLWSAAMRCCSSVCAVSWGPRETTGGH
jgi:hypothetical protein